MKQQQKMKNEADERRMRDAKTLKNWLRSQGGAGRSQAAKEHFRANGGISEARYSKLIHFMKAGGELEIHKTDGTNGYALALPGEYSRVRLRRVLKDMVGRYKSKRNQPDDPTPEEIKRRCAELRARDFAYMQEPEFVPDPRGATFHHE